MICENLTLHNYIIHRKQQSQIDPDAKIISCDTMHCPACKAVRRTLGHGQSDTCKKCGLRMTAHGNRLTCKKQATRN